MFVFFDGAVATALSLFVAILLGAYAEAYEHAWIFRNEAATTTISIVLTMGLIVGCITAWIACFEHGLPALPWMALYFAIQAGAVLLFRLLRPILPAPRYAT